jgi:ATP phosphoribosyltransferase regulatory subunit
MMYQAPLGGRDLFPLDVAQKRWIEDRLEAVVLGWGYHRMITSTVETMDTLMAGGAIDQSTVLELFSGGGQRLGLRPELTASIARAAVTRMQAVSYPQRLFYYANVFRRSKTGSHGQQQEYFQAGVELLGSSGLMADAEVVLLLVDALRALGLEHWSMILGEASLTRSLLKPFPEEWRDRIRVAISTLDRITLETLPLSDTLRQQALQIMDLRGEPQSVLAKVSQMPLEPDQQHLVDGLKSLIDLVSPMLTESNQLVLDLSLIQPFDYYTGIVFEVVSDGPHKRDVLGQGGRYDNLLNVYHPQGKGYPGIGFVLNVENLQQALLPESQLPTETPASDWLVAPITPDATAAALNYAQTIRQSTNLVRVELSLDPTQTSEQLRQLAQSRRISRIAWISAKGDPEIESI